MRVCVLCACGWVYVVCCVSVCVGLCVYAVGDAVVGVALVGLIVVGA